MNTEQAISDGTSGVFQFASRSEAMQRHRLPDTMHVQRIESENVTDKAGFLHATATAMRFPDYFGENWDAFYDCLTDRAESAQRGMVVIFSDLSRFAREAPEAFRMAVDVMTDAATYWEQTSCQLLVLVGLDDPGLATQLPSITSA